MSGEPTFFAKSDSQGHLSVFHRIGKEPCCMHLEVARNLAQTYRYEAVAMLDWNWTNAARFVRELDAAIEEVEHG